MIGINKEYSECEKSEKCKNNMTDEMKENSKMIQVLIKKIQDLKNPEVAPVDIGKSTT
jgi:hypothetical protein